MIPLCLIVGDSTGVGTASALAAQGVRCEIHARVGASSAEVAKTWKGSPPVARALLAIGSNDPTNPSLTRNLVLVRQRVTAARVTWLLPYNTFAARGREGRHLIRGSNRAAIVPAVDRPHPSAQLPTCCGQPRLERCFRIPAHRFRATRHRRSTRTPD